jgi:transcriptional regulator with XRE-family HTH domain
MEFEARIRKVRGSLTQRECARRLDIHVSTWQQYEDGNIPKGDILQRIHDEFHVDLNWLLTGQGEAYTGLEKESGHIAEDQGEYKVKKPLQNVLQPPEGGALSGVKRISPEGVAWESLSREEVALIRSLRFCGEAYRKRVYNAVSIRARNVLEEKGLQSEDRDDLREDLEVLSLSSIE